MEAKQEAVPERAKNGWPFPRNADSITRAIVEGYAPITPEFERDIATAKERMAGTLVEKEAAIAALQVVNRKHAASVAEYQGAIRRLNEYRPTLAKATGAV